MVNEATCGLRARKKAQTHEAILVAAAGLFERNGYERTTVEDIAAEANVSPRTFFRYFDSKFDVVRATKHDHQELEDLLAARPDEEGIVEAMHQIMRDDVARVLTEDPVAVRLFRVMMTSPSLRAFALEHFHDHQTELARVCAKRLRVGEDTLRPHVVAAAISTTVWTVVNRWIAEGSSPERLLPMVDEGFALLAAGLD